MHRFSLRHLTDAAVREGMKTCRARERSATAILVAHIAEAESRRLYVEDACDSMATYCMRELGLTEDAAYKRIHAGRIALRFPEIFGLLEDGRLHLTAVNLLAPRLTGSNATELMAAACGKSVFEIKELLAARFPQTEPLPLVLSEPNPDDSLVSKRLAGDGAPDQLVSKRVESPRAHVTPHAAGRYTATVAMNQATHDELRECAERLGHVLPSGTTSDVIAFALHQLVVQLRKRQHAATSRPAPVRSSSDPRHVPAHVRRAVYARDGGCCTFTSDDGRRCGTRRLLQYDHIVPVARGGESTVDNVRLRCHAHNQLEAEHVFGAAFMEQRREAARERAAAATASARDADALAALRALGYRKSQALHALVACGDLPSDATLEQRVKRALRQLLPAHQRLTVADLRAKFGAAAPVTPACAAAP